jgi:hypothetical protein
MGLTQTQESSFRVSDKYEFSNDITLSIDSLNFIPTRTQLEKLTYIQMCGLKLKVLRWRSKGSTNYLRCLTFETSDSYTSPPVGCYKDENGQALHTDRFVKLETRPDLAQIDFICEEEH